MSDTTTKSNFIPDGYNATAYIAERPRVHFESRFTFRPALHGERAKISADIAAAKDANTASMVMYREIEKRVVEWDQVNRKGEPLKPTAVNIARLAPEFVERLFSVVCGFGPADSDPATSGVVVVAEPDELTALLEGGPAVADAAQGADSKN